MGSSKYTIQPIKKMIVLPKSQTQITKTFYAHKNGSKLPTPTDTSEARLRFSTSSKLFTFRSDVAFFDFISINELLLVVPKYQNTCRQIMYGILCLLEYN